MCSFFYKQIQVLNGPILENKNISYAEIKRKSGKSESVNIYFTYQKLNLSQQWVVDS